MKKLIVILILLFNVTCFSKTIAPDDFKDKNVIVLIPSAPGGNMDLVAREVFSAIEKNTDITFTIINKPGAAGTIALSQVNTSKPDGTTILFGDTSLPILESLKNDPKLKDTLTVVTPPVSLYPGLLVNSDASYKTLNDFVLAMKKDPSKCNYAITTLGTVLISEQLVEETGIPSCQPILYKGGALSVEAVMKNEVSFALYADMSMTESGKIKPLAVGSEFRLNKYKDVPTIGELVKSIPQFQNMFCIILPTSTPKPIQEFFNQEWNRAVSDKELAESMSKKYRFVSTGNLDKSKKIHETNYDRLSNLYKKYKVKINTLGF